MGDDFIRTPLTDQGLFRLVITQGGLPMNIRGDQWAVAVSKTLIEIVEYLQTNPRNNSYVE